MNWSFRVEIEEKISLDSFHSLAALVLVTVKQNIAYKIKAVILFFPSKYTVLSASFFLTLPLLCIQYSTGVCQTLGTFRNSCAGTVFHSSYKANGWERDGVHIFFPYSSTIKTTEYMFVCVFMPKNLCASFFFQLKCLLV